MSSINQSNLFVKYTEVWRSIKINNKT